MSSPSHALLTVTPEPDAVSADECLRETPCDLCGGLDFELVARRDRCSRELPTVVCRTCGLVSHQAIPSDEELLSYYQWRYRRDYHGDSAPAPHRIVRAWRRGAALRRLLTPSLPPGAEVFDVGAGLGCTVKQFELAGFRATGIEPGEAFQDFAKRRLLARVVRSTWQEQPPRRQFQLVLLVHVIEHLSSPRAALAHLRGLLAAGGRLYVECPNLNSPHAAPGRLFHPAHVYNFTPATLSMLCRSCGFDVEASLAGERDRNLRFLLAPSKTALLQIDPESYPLTRQALSRYNALSYHLRWNYLRDRLHGLVRDLSDHWRARQRVGQIIAECQSRKGTQSDAGLPTRRVA